MAKAETHDKTFRELPATREAAEPRAENVSAPELAVRDDSVGINVFLGRSGARPDQLAGFVRYMHTQGFQKKLTMAAWADELAAFQNKPIG